MTDEMTTEERLERVEHYREKFDRGDFTVEDLEAMHEHVSVLEAEFVDDLEPMARRMASAMPSAKETIREIGEACVELSELGVKVNDDE